MAGALPIELPPQPYLTTKSKTKPIMNQVSDFPILPHQFLHSGYLWTDCKPFQNGLAR